MALIKCPMCGEDLHGEKICSNCRTDISKLEDEVCKDCNGSLEKCPECSSPVTESTKICAQCGYNIDDLKNRICKCCDKIAENALQKDAESQLVNKEDKNANGKLKRKLLLSIPCVILAVAFFIVYTQVHIYADATCTEPKTCKICKKTEGEELHHQWLRECEKPETCERCGFEQGEPIEHSWKEATCTTAKTCSKCGKIDGVALGHQGKWRTGIEATLNAVGTENEICTVCGEILGRNITDKRKPKVIGDHFNFDGAEFIKYIDDYLDSVKLNNVEADVDALNTLIADKGDSQGIGFSGECKIKCVS